MLEDMLWTIKKCAGFYSMLCSCELQLVHLKQYIQRILERPIEPLDANILSVRLKLDACHSGSKEQ